jgi:phospholipid/cholesterol/gamma-HCH transport system permease protein
MNAVARIGLGAYDVAELIVRSVAAVPYALRRHGLLFRHFYEVGNRSLFIVSLMGLFIGMILALQSGFQLRKFQQEANIGLIGLAIIKEFGPVITAFLLAGRIGSSYAAEIGTMKVYEEVDALKVLGVNPIGYLATPRLIACLVMVPLLTFYADLLASLGGCVVAYAYVDVHPRIFFDVYFQFLEMGDIWRAFVKTLFFGGIIAVTGCHVGLRTSGGAEGVGRSTTTSVVVALTAVLVSDYFLEKIMLAIT